MAVSQATPNRTPWVVRDLQIFSYASAGSVPEGQAPGTVFGNVAADTRAAGTEPASQQAFTFLILGLHEDQASAERFLANRVAWVDQAQEVWSVRASMTGVPGLRSQQSFFFPGVLECDPLTPTFWSSALIVRDPDVVS